MTTYLTDVSVAIEQLNTKLRAELLHGQPEAQRQVPLLQRSDGVERTGFMFPRGQVVTRIVGGVLGAPVARVRRDKLGALADLDLLDPARHRQLVMSEQLRLVHGEPNEDS